jgi:hypothetical protein
MDVPALKAKLMARTTLVLGEIRETVQSQASPEALGFIAIDVDFYSSAVDTLRVLLRPDVPQAPPGGVDFDDTDEHYNHRWAGEPLAIDEFNAASVAVKIDRWRGIRTGRPFHEAHWLNAMYLAHDLRAISATKLKSASARMAWPSGPLSDADPSTAICGAPDSPLPAEGGSVIFGR